MNNINFEDITVVVQGTTLENKNIRESMGKNGKRIYEEKFTAKIMANKFIDYYKSILKCRS